MNTQGDKAEKFLDLHQRDGILVLPNAFDVLSACLMADTGFEAVATTSGGCAFSLGYCDGENIPRQEMVAAIARISHALDIPVSADMEAGFGRNA
ncbi:MAG: isocitrate lyase/phosphoenolpyruvate mutase family protein, partial [Pseudomonadota bacterium]|nr:isocitrate lyase/phosphoenolpyruvate mutase family protein [Pseudomonadota bacterium]